MLEFSVGNTKVRLLRGDITDQDTDVIVNAANRSLMGGGGVDGDIHRKGGRRISEECEKVRATQYPDGLPAGRVVITSGGNLKARYVIHAVGPIWRGGREGESDLLADAYRNSLKLAVDNGLRSISFPSISTGAYGYPVDEASRIALQTAVKFLESEDRLEEVAFVLFTPSALQAFEQTAREMWET